MGKKAKLSHVYVKKSLSSTVSVSFLLEGVHLLGSGVQAGTTKRKPTTERERKKSQNRSLWRRNKIVREALNKKTEYRYTFM